MDTSNPSRPKGKKAGLKSQTRTRAAQAYWVLLTSKEDAPPFATARKGGLTLTDHGRAMVECWNALGDGRPALASDSVAIAPHSIQGILRIKSSAADAIDLPEAVRLFKARSARAIAAVDAPKAHGTKIVVDANNPPVTPKAAAAIWKRGFSERVLATLKQVVEARGLLKTMAIP